jgi:hypothetical protein
VREAVGADSGTSDSGSFNNGGDSSGGVPAL